MTPPVVPSQTLPPPRSAAAERARTLTNQVIDKRYHIVRKLGEGGMSYVYLGQEMASGDTVAIKVISPKISADPTSVERLRREAAFAMRLEHPNICRIFRYGLTEEGLIYLVMPYLAGELLSEREVREGPLSVEEGIPILVQLCQGLHHAHQLQLVHRDLKPENVMLVADESAPNAMRAVVMDFGLAKERQAGPEIMKLTSTGIVLGTPEFMSPEQIRGRPLDGRSDIYALGILAFEMFTGQLPFQGAGPQEMMIARLRGKPVPLRQVKPDLPAHLEAVLARAMAVEPGERYSSMPQFAAALAGQGEGGVFSRLFRR